MSDRRLFSMYDVAVALGAKADPGGGMPFGEFIRLGLPTLAGCQGCGATLAPYNSHPGKNGYIVGSCCADMYEVWDDLEAYLEHRKEARDGDQ